MNYVRPDTYPDGEQIPSSLPDLYQPADNPGVPSLQYCGNCVFYDAGYCDYWGAMVKFEYWCAAWQEIDY